MRNILGFFGNFLLSFIFSMDILNYYNLDAPFSINIINNDVNRVFIIWFGLITTLFSAIYFIDKRLRETAYKK